MSSFYERMDDPVATGVPCPECGAAANKRCREESGQTMTERYGRPRRYRHVLPHAARIHAARA